jgi:DNA-binding protein YbaB
LEIDMSMMDQTKMVMKMRKLQKELAKQVIEVDAGDGEIDPDRIDLDDIGELEGWIESGVKEAIDKSQKVAAEKMKPMMGQLGNLGL